jgi:hypothetical protein
MDGFGNLSPWKREGMGGKFTADFFNGFKSVGGLVKPTQIAIASSASPFL